MIKRIVKLEIDPNKRDEFIRLFEKINKQIVDFDGCISVDLLADIHANQIFFTYSTWLSKKHLDKYRNSIFFKENWNKVKPLFVNKPLAWSVREIL